VALIRALLADLNARRSDGSTKVYAAARKGCSEVVKILVSLSKAVFARLGISW